MSDYEPVGCRVIACGDVATPHGPEKADSVDVWRRLPAAIAATALAIGKPIAVYVGADGAVAYSLHGGAWHGMRYLGTYDRRATEAQVAADLARIET